MSNPVGHTIADLEDRMAKLRAGVKDTRKLVGKTTVDEGIDFLLGRNPATQRGIRRQIGETFGKGAMRFAGTNPIARGLVRAVPGVTLGITALDAADVVAGNEGIGNKFIDALAMGTGGVAGALVGGGPLGALAGAGAGKSIIDALQRIVGADRYSEEQRKMELANGGRL